VHPGDDWISFSMSPRSAAEISDHVASNFWLWSTGVNFRAGRNIAQQPEHLAKRAATMRQHRQGIQNWKPSDLPTWLIRDVYVKKIQPVLARVAKSQIRSILGVSEPYASDIQAGRCIPHPRFWQALAQLVDIGHED